MCARFSVPIRDTIGVAKFSLFHSSFFDLFSERRNNGHEGGQLPHAPARRMHNGLKGAQRVVQVEDTADTLPADIRIGHDDPSRHPAADARHKGGNRLPLRNDEIVAPRGDLPALALAAVYSTRRRIEGDPLSLAELFTACEGGIVQPDVDKAMIDGDRQDAIVIRNVERGSKRRRAQAAGENPERPARIAGSSTCATTTFRTPVPRPPARPPTATSSPMPGAPMPPTARPTRRRR